MIIEHDEELHKETMTVNDNYTVTGILKRNPKQYAGYMYEIGYKYKNGYTDYIIIKFNLMDYAENFIQALFNYYKNIIKELIINNDTTNNIINNTRNNYYYHEQLKDHNLFYEKLHPETNKIYINYPKLAFTDYHCIHKVAVRDFIYNTKNFTQVEIIQFLLMYYFSETRDITEKDINNFKNIAEQHSIKYPTYKDYYPTDGKDLYDLILYCNPSLHNYSKEIVQYMSIYPEITLQFKENIDVFYKTFILLNKKYNNNTVVHNYELNKKIKDYSIEELPLVQYSEMNDNSLIFRNKLLISGICANMNKLAEIINDLTVENLYIIFQKICEEIVYTDDIALMDSGFTDLKYWGHIFEICLNDNTNLTKEIRISTIKKLSNYKNLSTNNIASVIERKNYSTEIYTKHGVQLIVDYINSKDNLTENDVVLLDNFISMYILNSKMYFYLNKNLTGWIAYKLYSLMSNDDALEFTSYIYDMRINLTIDQWEEYLNNYEEYKDLPISWWGELV